MYSVLSLLLCHNCHCCCATGLVQGLEMKEPLTKAGYPHVTILSLGESEEGEDKSQSHPDEVKKKYPSSNTQSVSLHGFFQL